jgi:hypothetical protein
MQTRELVEARLALADRRFSRALLLLREAERVAGAQQKLEELLEVRDLARRVSALSAGHTKVSSEQLARRVDEHLTAFPRDALAAAGIDPERDLAVLVSKLRPLAGPHASAETRELSRARAALEDGELTTALAFLQEARRVAVAQGKLGELLAVHDLVQLLAKKNSARTRAAAEQLAHRVAADLRGFESAAGVS